MPPGEAIESPEYGSDARESIQALTKRAGHSPPEHAPEMEIRSMITPQTSARNSTKNSLPDYDDDRSQQFSTRSSFDLASFSTLRSGEDSDSADQSTLPSAEPLINAPAVKSSGQSNPLDIELLVRHRPFNRMDRWRVKLYCMQDGAWRDLGTGLCWGSVDSASGGSIFVVDENAPHRLLLKSRLTGNVGYQKHDTLIVWSERLCRDGVDATTELALSFQRTEGCLSICDFILHVAEHVDDGVALFVVVNPRYTAARSARGDDIDPMARMPGKDKQNSESGEGGNETADRTVAQADHNYRRSSSVSSEDASERVFTLPKMPPLPSADNVSAILESVYQTSRTQYGRDALAVFIRQRRFVPGLISLFNAFEGFRNQGTGPSTQVLGPINKYHGTKRLQVLRQMSSLIKLLFSLAEIDIILSLAEESTFCGILGILEYDRCFAPKKAAFRSYVSRHTKLSKLLVVQESSVKDKLGETYRLQLMRDIVLPHMVDDTILSIFGSLIFMNQMDLVSWLQSNREHITKLFTAFDNPAERETCETCLRFVCQVFSTLRSFPAPQRSEITAIMLECGLLRGVEWGLSKESDMFSQSMALEAVTSILDSEASLLHNSELNSNSNNTKDQEKPALPIALALAQSLAKRGPGDLQVQTFEALKTYLDSPLHPVIETLFYKEIAPRLYGAISNPDLTPWSQELIIELLEYSAPRHKACLKFAHQDSLLISLAEHIQSPRSKGSALAALKATKTLCHLGESSMAAAIAEHGILGATLDLLESQHNVSSATNSACLQLLATIATEPGHKYALLRNWLVNAREPQLKRLSYYSVLAYIERCAGTGSPGTITDADETSSDETSRKRSSRGSLVDLARQQNKRRLSSFRMLEAKNSLSDSGSDSDSSVHSVSSGPIISIEMHGDGTTDHSPDMSTRTIVKSPPMESQESSPILTPASPQRLPSLDDARRAKFEAFQLDQSTP